MVAVGLNFLFVFHVFSMNCFGVLVWALAAYLMIRIAQQPGAKVLRAPEREIFRQIKAPNCRDTGGISRFGNAELAEKIRSGRGLTFATGC